MALKSLRRNAEKNLCEDCYKIYKTLLEPTIRRFLVKPLEDWSEVESLVTRIVMKHKSVFKDDDLIFISLGEDSEQFTDKVDVEAFREIKYKWSFKWKICYLHKQEILGNASYKFLDKMREIRNRIHEIWLYEFAEEDLALFSFARAIMYQIYNATILNYGSVISETIKSNAEEVAKQCLSKITDH